MFLRTCFLMVSIVASPAVFAATAKEPFQLSASSTAEFRQQAEKLRGDMATGRYATLEGKDKQRVEKQLERLDTLYVKRSTGASMSDADAVALVNATSEINSVLTGNEDGRLVCEQVKMVGSNRSSKVCTTVADRRAQQKEADRKMRDRHIFSGR